MGSAGGQVARVVLAAAMLLQLASCECAEAGDLSVAHGQASGRGPVEPQRVASDGWFEVLEIDERTWAIAEPEYWQHNVSYLIAGEQRAILFDSGSGSEDITFIASRILERPITVIASHAHYDHIGSHAAFESVAMVDLPANRAHMDGTKYRPSLHDSLYWPLDDFEVTEWWPAGQAVDLGGRTLEVVAIPGHTPDSIALVDRARGLMFVGDHIYPGELYAFTPGADLQAYLHSTQRLIADYPETHTLLCAHVTPVMPARALRELEKTLVAILARTASGHRVWWLGGLVAEYPAAGFSLLAPAKLGT